MSFSHCLAPFLAICTALACTSGQAAIFNVSNTDDAGSGSLRQALIDAGANSESDTIDLSGIAGQTIALTSGELQITSDTVLVAGAGVTIDAQQNSRILFIQSSDVTLNELTITGGVADFGGGIWAANSTLVLDSIVVSFNYSPGVGGGISAIGVDLDLIDSTILGNTSDTAGGGVLAIGTSGFSMTQSRVMSNQVTGLRSGAIGLDGLIDPQMFASRGLFDGEGGGMVVLADLIEVQQSTIAGNQAATDAGGALFATIGFRGPQISSVVIDGSTISNNTAQSAGGFQAVADIAIRLTNSTVSNNIASDSVGGAAMFVSAGGSVATFYSTIVENTAGTDGGGLVLSTLDNMVSIASSVISGNNAPIDPDVLLHPVPMPTPVIVRQSLIGTDPLTGTLSKDATSLALAGQDPRLGPLGDNTGPTLTHAPIVGSPLLNVIAPGDIGCGTTVVFDQRGLPRPDQGACDIGSVEGSIEPPILPIAVPAMDRLGLAALALLLGLAGFIAMRRRCVQTIANL